MNMDKYIGRRLDSRYEIQELIGMGGMAMVYKAYDSIDDKTVAIKILKDEFLGNEEFLRRFKNSKNISDSRKLFHGKRLYTLPYRF